MKYLEVYAKDVLNDDNNGYLYGVEWYEKSYEDMPLDVMWFKTQRERKKFIKYDLLDNARPIDFNALLGLVVIFVGGFIVLGVSAWGFYNIWWDLLIRQIIK